MGHSATNYNHEVVPWQLNDTHSIKKVTEETTRKSLIAANHYGYGGPTYKMEKIKSIKLESLDHQIQKENK